MTTKTSSLSWSLLLSAAAVEGDTPRARGPTRCGRHHDRREALWIWRRARAAVAGKGCYAWWGPFGLETELGMGLGGAQYVPGARRSAQGGGARGFESVCSARRTDGRGLRPPGAPKPKRAAGAREDITERKAPRKVSYHVDSEAEPLGLWPFFGACEARGGARTRFRPRTRLRGRLE